MNIPEKINLKLSLHGHGDKGLSIYGYEDTHGLGIAVDSRRERHGAPYVETWTIDALPEQTFATLKELAQAVAHLTDAEVEAERSKFPQIRDVRKDPCGNRCRLCAFNPQERMPHDTTHLYVFTSWKSFRSGSLCHTHLQQYQHAPVELLAAFEAEVEERRQRAEAREAQS